MIDKKNGIGKKALQMSPFIVMDILKKAKQMESEGENIIHLEIGEPDQATPEPIIEAAKRALQDGDTHYTPSLGKPELREAIAHYYHIKYGVNVSPEQIIITSGTSPAMLLNFGVLLEKGDEVILSDPHYSCYPNFIRYSDGVPVYVEVKEENGFKYQIEDIKAKLSHRTKAVMLNSPANPTGNVFTGKELKELSSLDTYIISDEIYNGLIYEGEEHTILEYTDQAFVINGFSKLYAMTGWRLGYIIAPPKFIRAIEKLQQNLFICASSFAQTAAITALTECEDHITKIVNTYDKRRRYLLNRLKSMGLATIVEPTGAFYALANVKKYTNDSYSFAFDILDKAKVALTPGIDFGKNCEGYVRISYANSLSNIKEGMDRLEKFLSNLE
ncbi:MAG: (5-formylfuran-3-yl)methyl phosphate transaminase [Clostridia bacterium]|nr:(5-formylfuran-3-yl)methyl phosphate transaminase [Clostridia bacterium]